MPRRNALPLRAYIEQEALCTRQQHDKRYMGEAVARYLIRRLHEEAKFSRLCQQYEAEDALNDLAAEFEQELEET